MDTELLDISAALICYLTKSERNICILTDSREAVEVLNRSNPCDYSLRISEQRSVPTCLLKKQILFQWIPVHCGIAGNKKVDDTAKLAVNVASVQAAHILSGT